MGHVGREARGGLETIREEQFLGFMHKAEQLKCELRHGWTSSGRRESVAEHSWRLCLAAWLLKEEFPDLNMERLLELCLLHDLGETMTGDIPAFEKNEEDEAREREASEKLSSLLPEAKGRELIDRLREFEEGRTLEAKAARALDKMEAVIQHNESRIDTWLPLEYDLQLTHGTKEAKEIPQLARLREAVKEETIRKIRKEGSER